jgi:DNA-binding transcriptional ArsR family regulator
MPSTDTPRPDEIFGILQNRRRRLCLRYLESEPETTIGEVAEHIASVENDIPPAELRSKQRKRVYISLYQSHLPAMADAGAIEYERDRGTVKAGEAVEDFLAVLERCETPEQDPKLARLGFSLGGAILLSSVLALGIIPGIFSWIHVLGVATLSVGIVSLLFVTGFVETDCDCVILDLLSRFFK